MQKKQNHHSHTHKKKRAMSLRAMSLFLLYNSLQCMRIRTRRMPGDAKKQNHHSHAHTKKRAMSLFLYNSLQCMRIRRMPGDAVSSIYLCRFLQHPILSVGILP
jgi:hypothetical protein